MLTPSYSGMCALLKETLLILDRDISLCQNRYESEVMVREAYLLAALYEVNLEL